MRNECEYLKSLNLVEFLSSYYQRQFRPAGSSQVCLSPFTNETKPGFHVQPAADGHWLFKDFSSDYGGSIIDFVLIKEQLTAVSQAVVHLRKLFNLTPPTATPAPFTAARSAASPSYDLEALYQQMKRNDTARGHDYLSGRGISPALIQQLENDGILLHNIHQGVSYCSFAVYDAAHRLRGIDNHRMDARQKFVLGHKQPFSLDWPDLQVSPQVHICESIIDYLSLKTLEGASVRGLALLGNQCRNYDLSFLQAVPTLVSCFDNDVGGFRGYLDLTEQFPEKQIVIYELPPGQKDINERLLTEKRERPTTQLTAADKLAIYKEFIRRGNHRQLAQAKGIDRSYLYKIVKDCEAVLLNQFSERQPGRKAADKESRSAANERIVALEQANQQLAKEKAQHYARSEFLKLRLKWAEYEVVELRGKKPESATPAQMQLKKRERRNAGLI